MAPRSSTHARQRAKNLFFLIALLLLVGGFFYLSILKTAEQQKPVPETAPAAKAHAQKH